MLGRLVTHWDDIVGRDLAAKAQPVKIRYRKVPDQKGMDAALDIAASTADATLLHYRKDLILERINQIFGERLISAIRFVPMAVNETLPTNQKRRPRAPVPAAKRAELAITLDMVNDPELKQRLEVLGTSILQDALF